MPANISRKSGFILALVALLVIAAVVGYRMMMGSTNTAIRHAEAFIFRRMSVSRWQSRDSTAFSTAPTAPPKEVKTTSATSESRDCDLASSIRKFNQALAWEC